MSEQQSVAHWLTIHDELLRGLTHALSNRVATISAAATLLELPAASGAQAAETLRSEADRLEMLLQIMRQLPLTTHARAEPVIVDDVVQSAIALFSFHADARDVRCASRADGDVAPAWTDPDLLRLSIVTALVSVLLQLRDRDSNSHPKLAITVRSDEEQVSLAVLAIGPDESALSIEQSIHQSYADGNAAINWLLRDCDGHATANVLGIQIQVMSLKAARKKR